MDQDETGQRPWVDGSSEAVKLARKSRSRIAPDKVLALMCSLKTRCARRSANLGCMEHSLFKLRTPETNQFSWPAFLYSHQPTNPLGGILYACAGEDQMNEAEMWQSDSEWLKKEMGTDITKRKIRKVSFKHDGKVLMAGEDRCRPPKNGTRPSTRPLPSS